MKNSLKYLTLVALVVSCKGSPSRPRLPTPPPPTTTSTSPCDGDNQAPRTRLFYAAECASPILRLDLLADVDRVNDTFTFSAVNSVDDVCDVITAPQVLDVCVDAEAAFMAMLLNIAEGRLEMCTCLKSPGIDTVAKAALVIDLLLVNPARTPLQCGEALLLAGGINSRLLLDNCASTTPTPTPSPTGSPSPTPTGSPTPPPVPPVPAGCQNTGTVVFVPAGGSIQAALATQKNNLVIVIADGSYAGPINIGGNKVTIVAQNSGAAVIAGGVTMSFNNECLVGMGVIGTVAINKNNNTVDDCNITGDVLVSDNNSVVTGNTIGGSVAVSGNNNIVTGNNIGGTVTDTGKNNNTSGNL